MNFFKKESYNLKVKKQLYLVYTLAIVIPILVIGIYLVVNSYNLIWNHHKDMLISDNLRARNIVFDVTTSVVNICDNIANDNQLQELLSSKETDNLEAKRLLSNYKQLSDYYGRHTEISTITLFVNNDLIGQDRHVKKVTEDVSTSEWYQKAINKIGYNWTWISIDAENQGKQNELALTFNIPVHGRSEYALLVITISNNYLKNRIDNNNLKIDLAVDQNPIFYSNWGHKDKIIDHEIDYNQTYYSFSGMSSYFGDRELTEISTFKPVKGESKIYIVSADPAAKDASRKILLITLSVLLIGTIIPFIIISKFTKVFSDRVVVLREEMHRVSEGDYNIIDTFVGTDELADLFHDLKVMIESIKKRDSEIFESRLNEQKLINHQQQMQFELLSSKMNPHFLYNTLETIRMMAFNGDDLIVANAVKLFGKYMRYNLEKTGLFTTLQDELEFIQVYLDIQKLRFGSRINYEIKVGQDVKPLDYDIMPLIIQPVVENAIIHGLEGKIEGGLIEINVEASRNNMLISIRDNGVGISPAKLEALKESLYTDQPSKNSSIGLKNTQQRIQLKFGKSYGLRIFSDENQGTLIQIVLPNKVERG